MGGRTFVRGNRSRDRERAKGRRVIPELAPGSRRLAAGYLSGLLVVALLAGAMLWGLTHSVTLRLHDAVATGRLAVVERGIAREGLVLYLLVLAAAALTTWSRYQRRRDEAGRARNLGAQLALHRLADTVARVRSEDELFRAALDIVASGTGVERWALYLRRREPEGLTLVASRELHRDVLATLSTSPPPSDAACPGRSAVWRRDGIVCRNSPRCTHSFGDQPASPEHPTTAACVPMISDGETIGVLQGFTPCDRGFGTEEMALARWMAAELAHGLRRRELERRDRILASYMLRTGEILMGVDDAGTITYVNPAGERMLGESGAALRGRSLDAVLRAEEDGEEPSLLEALRRDGALSGDVWCARSDGTRFPVEVTAAAASADREEHEEFVVLARDATERHEHDRQLRAHHDALEFLNLQLEKANERLLVTDRMKNDFIANMSHELRTPLNAVIGFATLLEQGMLESPAEQAGFAQSIREAAEHLLRLINDILDLAKMEAGRFDLELEPGDLGRVARAAATTVESQARRKGLAVRVDVPDEPLPVLLDTARMRQVLLNLLGNAIKFTEKGEVRLSARRGVDPGRVVVLIEDTGIGIAREKQGLLFQKFSQVDMSYRRRHQGAGLGLTISRSLTERMSGTISVTSEGLGRGARVTLEFPVHEGSAGTPPGDAAGTGDAGRPDTAATGPVASNR
jgi:PAS domain S-box-containing protein